MVSENSCITHRAGRAGVRRLAMAAVSGLALALGMGGMAAAEEATIVDDAGRSVTIDLPVSRVAVFNPWNAELFRAIGGADSLVGLDRGTASNPGYWPEALTEAIIGENQSDPNYDAIVALDPDVLVIPRNGAWEQAIQQLEPFDIPVVVMTGWDVLLHSDNARLVGQLVGEPEQAEAVVDFYEDTAALLAERLEGVEPRRVYVENQQPFRSPLVGSGWHDMIVIGGGENIFGDIAFAEQPVSGGSVHDYAVDPEAVIVRDPEAIFLLGAGGLSYPAPSPDALREQAEAIAARPELAGVTAVRNGEVHVIGFFAANIVSKIIASVYVAKALYPDRFADVDPEALVRTWLEDFQGVPYTGAYSYSLR